MIKLFWNTSNQKKPSSKIKKIREKEELDYGWGKYHKKSSDKWIYEILNKIHYKVVQNENDLESEDVLIIIDSNVEKKIEFYSKLKARCRKIFLIHLGDESGIYDLSLIYNKFNFVWRSFCSNRYFNNNRVSCLPIGYKSGTFFKKEMDERKYKWAFIGTPHKSSRHDLLFQLSDIEPSFSYKTNKFNEKIMEVDEMSAILS